jgi:hypothetical protein
LTYKDQFLAFTLISEFFKEVLWQLSVHVAKTHRNYDLLKCSNENQFN